MKKKIVFGLAMLIVLTASLFAQVASVKTFRYAGLLNEQSFNKFANERSIERPWFDVGKLSDPIINAINNNLRNYSLNNGDTFLAWIDY